MAILQQLPASSTGRGLDAASRETQENRNSDGREDDEDDDQERPTACHRINPGLCILAVRLPTSASRAAAIRSGIF